ncbi:cell wall hydrolase [Pseudorhodoplanes sinuspersici]|nr:cell wall hydrolase [Pseudorhodoplanes sinuspersici]RKE73097.1 cell wall hydrolase [Pseudorhodoplanes sinuspersici]
MQPKTALFHLAFATTIACLNIGHAQARAVLFEEPRVIRDDNIDISRNIVAETQLYCLALAVYFEGGSTDEPEIGQRHVARVVVARANANRAIWGGSNICDVVFYQRSKTCQFSFACLPSARRTPRGGAAWTYSMAIAKDELEGRSNVEEQSIRYYMNAALTSPRNACRFRKEFVPVVQAGRHEFFREASTAERIELAKAEHAECKRQEALKKKKVAKAKRALAAAKKQPPKKVTVARR